MLHNVWQKANQYYTDALHVRSAVRPRRSAVDGRSKVASSRPITGFV